MKYCPKCRSSYSDDTLQFCLQDGAPLTNFLKQASLDPTVQWQGNETVFSNLPNQTEKLEKRSKKGVGAIIFVALLFLSFGIGGTFFVVKYLSSTKTGDNQVGNLSSRPDSSKSAVSNQAKNENSTSNTPTPTPTPKPMQLLAKTADAKIKQELKENDLEETDKSKRKTVFGDLDNDGDEDAAVEVGWNFIGGNGWGTKLFIFEYENGLFEYVTHDVIGEKGNRSTSLKAIKNGQISIDTQSYAADDADCCPSIKGSTIYILKDGSLVEIKK